MRGEGIAGFALGAALPLGLLCGWIAWVGQWQNFWFWSFRYAREYLGFVTPAEALDFASYGFTQVAGSAPMLWVLSAVGIADALLRRERTPSRVFLYGFTLVSVLALSLGLRFRPHYFLFVLPGVAIWAALGARALGARLPSLLSLPQTSVVGGGILGIALLWGVYAERAYFFEMGPEEVSVANFGRNPFPEALAVGRKLRELSDPGDRIAVLASEPEIYFYAERKSATPFLYTTEVLRRSSTSQALHHDLVASLSKDPPPFLVLSSRFNPFKGADRNVTPLTRWIRNATASGYRRIGVVEIRRGETSRQRWGAAAAGRPSSKAWLMVYQRSAKASSPSGPSL
ncbi:MAG: hypothetical protein GY946_02090 [bacterium]|nr:hypothetical protein [bacterium]